MGGVGGTCADSRYTSVTVADCAFSLLREPRSAAKLQRRLHSGYTAITRRLHGGDTAVISRLHGGHMAVTRRGSNRGPGDMAEVAGAVQASVATAAGM